MTEHGTRSSQGVSIPWRDRVAIWRMAILPYRVYEWVGPDDGEADDPECWGHAEWLGPSWFLWLRERWLRV